MTRLVFDRSLPSPPPYRTHPASIFCYRIRVKFGRVTHHARNFARILNVINGHRVHFLLPAPWACGRPPPAAYPGFYLPKSCLSDAKPVRFMIGCTRHDVLCLLCPSVTHHAPSFIGIISYLLATRDAIHEWVLTSYALSWDCTLHTLCIPIQCRLGILYGSQGVPRVLKASPMYYVTRSFWSYETRRYASGCIMWRLLVVLCYKTLISEPKRYLLYFF